MNFKMLLLVIASIFVYQKFIKSETVVEPVVSKQVLPLEDLNINFYTTSWCQYCKAARQYMDANKIPYTEYDIEKDALGKIKHERLIKEYNKKGKTGVPLFEINNKLVYGYSKKKLSREIKLARGL